MPISRVKGTRTYIARMTLTCLRRWLRDKYWKAVVGCMGGKDEIFDNLYLDANSIVHDCSHGDDLGDVKPKTEKAMFEIIFHYIDRMVTAIKLRKLLYIALDGVAPRAKLNQQRSRRFRSAQVFSTPTLNASPNANPNADPNANPNPNPKS